ncbi:MAG: hypothetical protein HY720_32805 [Planctomycetes bacterium]|nr:hypothetical protein [Planctomycetota bacterium]
MTATRLAWAALGLGALALAASTAAVLTGREASAPPPLLSTDDREREILTKEIAELRRDLAAARGEWAEHQERPAPSPDVPPKENRDEDREKILARLSALEARASKERDWSAGTTPLPVEESASEAREVGEKLRRTRAKAEAADEAPSPVREAIVLAGVSEESSRPLAREVSRWESALAEIRVREKMGEDVSREIEDFQASVRSQCHALLSPSEYDAFSSGFAHLTGREEDEVDENPPPPPSGVNPPAHEPETLPARSREEGR